MRPLQAALLLLATACAPAPKSPTPAADGLVRVRGRLVPDGEFLDGEKYRAAFAASPSPFRGAEIVFAGAAGDVVAVAGADGRYDVRLARGSHRVFVRGEWAVSGAPNVWFEPAYLAGEAGRPRLDLAPSVELSADVVGLDVPVIHAGRIVGQVVAGGRPVQGAVVRTGSNSIVVAGTDIAVTDATGHYELVTSPGPRTLEVTHPELARAASPWLYLEPGQRIVHDLTMTAGCAVSGRVVGPDGRPAGPGEFDDGGILSPTPIAPDGTFRVTTTDSGPVVLRARITQMGPSAARKFACKPGARFEGVTFRVAATTPSLTGVVLRRDGKPMPSARVLALAANSGEKHYAVTDAEGRFTLRGASRGHYGITASTPDDGLARAEVTLPRRDLRLVLGGITRIEGTSPHLREGAFLLRLPILGRTERGLDRLVPVHDGRFSVEVPASIARVELFWQDHTGWFAIDFRRSVNRVAVILGTPRPKRVRGVMRLAGKPVPGVVYALATPRASRPTSVEVDRDGRFVIDSYSGAELTAEWSPDDCDDCDGATGYAQISSRAGRAEQLEIDLVQDDFGED